MAPGSASEDATKRLSTAHMGVHLVHLVKSSIRLFAIEAVAAGPPRKTAFAGIVQSDQTK